MTTILQRSLNRDLIEAATAGDLAGACRALDAGAKTTGTVPGMHSGAIHCAIEMGSLEIVQTLLDRGCPADHLASVGFSPLSVALHELADAREHSTDTRSLTLIIDLLLQAGPRAVRCADQSPLALAHSYGFEELAVRIEALLARRGDWHHLKPCQAKGTPMGALDDTNSNNQRRT